MRIENKRQMQALLAEGAFGNTTRLWPSVRQFFTETLAPVPSRVGLRSFSPAQPMYPLLSVEEVASLAKSGLDLDGYYVQEVADPVHIKMAGEVSRTERGLILTYSLVKKPMRDAFAEKTYFAKGLLAQMALGLYAEPEDVEHLYDLLDTYPDHVVEFTCFNVPLGHLQRKMIIWEVRAY